MTTTETTAHLVARDVAEFVAVGDDLLCGADRKEGHAGVLVRRAGKLVVECA